jgi:hypothetical protein
MKRNEPTKSESVYRPVSQSAFREPEKQNRQEIGNNEAGQPKMPSGNGGEPLAVAQESRGLLFRVRFFIGARRRLRRDPDIQG